MRKWDKHCVKTWFLSCRFTFSISFSQRQSCDSVVNEENNNCHHQITDVFKVIKHQYLHVSTVSSDYNFFTTFQRATVPTTLHDLALSVLSPNHIIPRFSIYERYCISFSCRWFRFHATVVYTLVVAIRARPHCCLSEPNSFFTHHLFDYGTQTNFLLLQLWQLD